MKQWLNAFRDIFFPRLCLHCLAKVNDDIFCRECRSKLIPAKVSALPDNAYYETLICGVEYHGPIVTAIHKFKYAHQDYLACALAELLHDKFSRFAVKADLMTCVPSHPAKIKERGYNPAQLLAENLAKSFNIPFIDDIIYETDYRRSQTTVDKASRARNSEKAFCAVSGYEGKTVILVDDVYTTGATMNSCARALKDKGIKRITALTIAKTHENNP